MERRCKGRNKGKWVTKVDELVFLKIDELTEVKKNGY